MMRTLLVVSAAVIAVAAIPAAASAGVASRGGVSASLAAPARESAAIPTRGLCLVSSTAECLDYPGPSNQLQVDSGVNYALGQTEPGIVTSTPQYSWPFTPGSGWNARYAGSEVLTYVADGSGGACMRTDDVFDGDNGIAVYDAPGSACTNWSKPSVLWVARGTWLVNVGQTDGDPSTGDPQILNAGCTGHGCKVWVSPAGKASAGGLNWEYAA
jgi:hypothetical protein